ncbi:hypothetical protein PTSG_04213 [Salpingoeca rosetta]|uniref:GDPGP1-like N-terminal domain-containing protein n=1 Tax=Salpingoeca rosetta (strain ATCC 50818 / BSB-021) TaxID=946362 RepID=F2U6X3_SALR5|nr:uncharacterized protein PTSG_04213 [Salpingoeca rosetta]EGD83605.1 hypothetical protein PTSG_04213 [Salpingoeca rosetta]|eukprot:XP_004995109.1 hypothetical protein PTSG_04213 [Salpingoeca rosetta]
MMRRSSVVLFVAVGLIVVGTALLSLYINTAQRVVPLEAVCSGADAVRVHPLEAPMLEQLLKQQWTAKAADEHVMPNVPANLLTRTMHTEMGDVLFVHNPERLHKRVTQQSRRQSAKVNLRRPFDPRDFHFGKVSLNEFLFVMTDDANAHDECTAFSDIQAFHRPVHAVLVNKSPLSKYSGLLVPFLREQRNQVMTADALLVGLGFANRLQGSGIRVGFNSLYAGASVNHLHFQFWWDTHALPIELAEMTTVTATDRLLVERDAGYLSSFLRFTYDRAAPGVVVEALMPALQHLTRRNTPYNLVLVPGMVYLLPRQPMLKQLGSINVGFPEVSGTPLVPSHDDFVALTAEDVVRHWTTHVRVPSTVFDELVDIIVDS